MKVLYVSPTVGVHDDRFVAAWREGGADVSVFRGDSTDGLSLKRAIDELAPDLVQAGPLPTAAFDVASVWSGPLLATSWGFDLMSDADRDDATRLKIETVLRRAEVLLVDNQAVARRAVELGAFDDRITCFPWGVDHSIYHRDGGDLREELALLRSDFVVLSVRRHEPLYEVETLIEAFTALLAKSPNARLILGGSGSATGELRGAVAAQSMDDVVRFPGNLNGEELAGLYRSADVYVSTSPVDGSSISLLEAMACGVAPLVTDIPGNREWVDGNTGLTFESGSAAELSESLLLLAAEPALRRRLSDAAARRAREGADWAKGQHQLLEAAREAVDRNRQGASIA